MLQKFKAKQTFAAGKNIFHSFSDEPHIEKLETVESWAAAGYVELIGEPFNEVLEVDNTKAPEETETAKIEPVEAQEIDLNKADYETLKELAKKAGIPNYNTTKKKDLIKALKGE